MESNLKQMSVSTIEDYGFLHFSFSRIVIFQHEILLLSMKMLYRCPISRTMQQHMHWSACICQIRRKVSTPTQSRVSTTSTGCCKLKGHIPCLKEYTPVSLCNEAHTVKSSRHTTNQEQCVYDQTVNTLPGHQQICHTFPT